MYACDATVKCRWQVTATQRPAAESLDKQLARTSARARFVGYCDADYPRPLVVDGWAISTSPRVTLTQASSAVSTALWEVHHIRTCFACRYTEGRGRVEARVAFKARAGIRDPLGSDANAEVFASLRAHESTTGCEARLAGAGVAVGSSGSVTIGASAGGGTDGAGGGAGLSSSVNRGNLREIEQLFHDSDGPIEVEDNDYYVTMEAALDRGVLQVDGWPLGHAQAFVDVAPSEYLLRIHLSCDNCSEADSRMEAVFPQ